MAEYIERDAAIAACYDGFADCRDDCAANIRNIPAADVVERKTGKWIEYPECLKYANAYTDDHIVCSACEECFSVLDNDCERFNFCPHCGAKMIGGDDDV